MSTVPLLKMSVVHFTVPRDQLSAFDGDIQTDLVTAAAAHIRIGANLAAFSC